MALSIAWNFACVSASSASGSLSATIPPPATSRADRRSSDKFGATQRHGPLTVTGSIAPADGAAVTTALEPLDLDDQLDRRIARVPPDRRGRLQRPHQFDHGRSRLRQHALRL